MPSLLDNVDLRLGRWQDVLAGVKADHLIVDAPYSNRTHGAAVKTEIKRNWLKDSYSPWGQPEIAEVADWAVSHVKGWVVSLTDHVLYPIWEQELRRCGYYVFAPVILVEKARNVRLRGDGPSCWATMVCVARRKGDRHLTEKVSANWGALPGAYECFLLDRDTDKMLGGKPLRAMEALVSDYSEEGDTIVDLCAGYGTTLLAAAKLGRKAIGAEMDPQNYAAAKKRLEDRLHSPLFDGPHQQTDLWG
jgi:site-specific DNA-methyltransferase (adenine-specific)